MASALAHLRWQAADGALDLTRADLPALQYAPRGNAEVIAARGVLADMIAALQVRAEAVVDGQRLGSTAAARSRRVHLLARGVRQLRLVMTTPPFVPAASGSATAWCVQCEALLAALQPESADGLPEQGFFAPLA